MQLGSCKLLKWVPLILLRFNSTNFGRALILKWSDILNRENRVANGKCSFQGA